jgi:hypothetical protein
MLDNNGREQLREGFRLSAVGIEIALCVVLGLAGGLWLDRRFDSAPALTLVLGAAGVGAAIKVVLRLIKHTNLDEK